MHKGSQQYKPTPLLDDFSTLQKFLGLKAKLSVVVLTPYTL